jgi:hypothetical protein
MQAIDRINAAFQHRDGRTHESLTTADYIRVSSNGRVFSRTDFLKTVVAAGEERGPSHSQAGHSVDHGACAEHGHTAAGRANRT